MSTMLALRWSTGNLRIMRKVVLFLFVAVALASCGRAVPPQGRWEATYESGDTLIAARLEIEPDGQVRICAPDLQGVGGSEDEKNSARQRLATGLADAWDGVSPRPFDFDGTVFRKPGGIAPQLVWDAGQKTMTLVVYLGTRPALDIAMHSVDDFHADPWGGE
jgi:hypothetical protein